MELHRLNSSAGMKTAVSLIWQDNKACNAAIQTALAWVRKYSYTVLWVMQASRDLGSVSSAFWEVMFSGLAVWSSWCWNTCSMSGLETEGTRREINAFSHNMLSTHQLFSISHMRHRALRVVNVLKAPLSVPCTLTIETSFLSSSMSLSFFPFFFFAPCSDVAVGSYLSLPACKWRHSTVRNTLQSTSTVVDMNYAQETAMQTKRLQFIKVMPLQ